MKRQLLTILVCSLLSLAHVHAQKTVTALQYWTDEGSRTEMTISGEEAAFAVDASKLSEGLHTLSYRLKDSEGTYGPLQTWVFLRLKTGGTASEKKVSACQYWTDDGNRTEVTANNGEAAFAVDASKLPEGLHTLNYRLKDSEGIYGPLQTWVFLRKAIGEALAAPSVKSVEYWIDDNVAATKTQAITDGTVSFAIDASELASGLHKLCYRVRDSRGALSPAQTWVFLKNEGQTAAARKIAWCKYWWNDHVDKAVTETAVSGDATFVFEKQLSVPDYAKTDGFLGGSTARFNIVFGDDTGRTSALKSFDVEYPDEIPPISAIEADKEETTGSVVLTWTANESNIADYNIYYSEGDQPFVLWLPNTTKTTATFKGQAGKTYRFTVTARDKAGNSEAMDEKKCATVKFTSAN